MHKVTFNNRNAVFFPSLKKAVEDYFTQTNTRKTGNIHLFTKTLVLIPAAILIYVSVLAFTMPAWAAISLCIILGLILASIGFNVMHDACHGSYSSKKWVNETLGLSLNALGGNAFIWKFKHNIIHHTYTNVDGLDDDIAKSPLMRQCQTQTWKPAHRFQHLYVIFLYAISSMAWVLMLDYDKYFKQRIQNTDLQKMDAKEHFLFWFSKVLYIVFYVAIPVLCVGWGPWAICFVSMHLAMGVTLAIVFQLAHVVEHTEFEASGIDDKMIQNEWAIHQLKTTANFAPKNKIIGWFVGGLNYQVEHHLFPRISHVHYPQISKIVEQKCKEFDIPYHSFPTMTSSVISHFKMLKKLGRKPAA